MKHTHRIHSAGTIRHRINRSQVAHTMQQALHETRPEEILIPVDHQALPGELYVPAQAIGLVIFAHGSGSSRLSPRNTAVASSLNNVRLATLLFDLLTPVEDRDFNNRFDIDLLASRLVHVVRWMKQYYDTATLPIGLFGASTGAAAALKAAALENDVQAIVSRGGRPDLAGDALSKVKVPTLLLVGGRDAEVEDLNRNAFARLAGIKKISIVPNATHLFEEPGTLEEVARQTADWFVKYLP